MDRLKPFTIIPDPEYRLPGYKSTRVARSLASFRAGTGFLTFNCNNVRQHLNVQRMIQLFATGESPLLVGANMTSEDILIQTSVSHELRHFHDCLLSFTFFEALRRKLLLNVNSVKLFKHLPREQDAHLPAGLLDWIMTDEDQRLQRKAQWREFYGTEVRLRNIPYFSDERLEEQTRPPKSTEGLFLACARGAVSIRTLLTTDYRDKSGARFSAMDVYELSAISTQLLSITDRFGVHPASDIYWNVFHDTYYDRVLDVIDDLITEDGNKIISGTDVLILASAMSLWAICAEPPEPALQLEKACPAVRFLQLKLKLLQDRSGVKDALGNADYLLEYFDNLMESEATCNRISASTTFFKKWTSEIEAQAGSTEPNSPMFLSLQYWKELLYMRDELQRAAFDDLFFYLRGTYESTKVFGLTLPPIIFNSAGYDFQNLKDYEGEDGVEAANVTQQMWRESDRINRIRDATEWVHVHEAVFDKVYLDNEASSSVHHSMLMQVVRAVTGSDIVRLPV
jgi:hypothetical protein